MTKTKPSLAPVRRMLMVQVSDEQRSLLDAAAAASDLPTSTWVRMIALAAARERRVPR